MATEEGNVVLCHVRLEHGPVNCFQTFDGSPVSELAGINGSSIVAKEAGLFNFAYESLIQGARSAVELETPVANLIPTGMSLYFHFFFTPNRGKLWRIIGCVLSGIQPISIDSGAVALFKCGPILFWLAWQDECNVWAVVVFTTEISNGVDKKVDVVLGYVRAAILNEVFRRSDQTLGGIKVGQNDLLNIPFALRIS